jgi:hypothetical protein
VVADLRVQEELEAALVEQEEKPVDRDRDIPNGRVVDHHLGVRPHAALDPEPDAGPGGTADERLRQRGPSLRGELEPDGRIPGRGRVG